MTPTFARTTFKTSRLLEFFKPEELRMQIGADTASWPLALTKELIDNALDACETASIAPEITVTVGQDFLRVKDNGPGLPVETMEGSMDYLVRVSDKSHYVSPSRGQLGNALKCVWAAAYVVSGNHGVTEVAMGGLIHRIEVRLDRIAQKPLIDWTHRPNPHVQTGTCLTIHWPQVASYQVPEERSNLYTTRFDRRVVSLVEAYAAFNPHATFHYAYAGEQLTWEATNVTWQKWRPCDRTSPHWYTAERMRSLIAGYLTDDESTGKAKTLRAFVAEFCGLRRSDQQKLVIDATGMSGAYLRDLVDGHGHDIDMTLVAALLTAMQREAKPVKPSALGIIGETSVRQQLLRSFPLAPESVKYKKVAGEVGGLPFVLEVACGWNAETQDRGRRVMVGVNWTPTLSSPFTALQSILGEARVDRDDDVVVWVHLALPRPDFTDRGKTQLSLPVEINEALNRSVRLVTKVWTGMKLDADRQQRVTDRQRAFALQSQRRERISVKDAAYQVMERAYHDAAGRLNVATARQIMYAARPAIIELTGKARPWKRSSRFTQHLLPDFIAEYPGLTATWDVVWDDRGHFIEPHTAHQLGIGGIAVRRYIREWEASVPHHFPVLLLDHRVQTSGPANRFQFVLFIEKEGFMLHLEAAKLAERYDLAIMSTKGMTVTAARALIEALSRKGVTILVVHDFDKSGFSILHTMRTNTRRYQFKGIPNVIGLGLRLTDVRAMGLDSEEVDYPKAKVDPRINLRASEATEEECNFLVQQDRPPWKGERVELNALGTDLLITWLEQKLVAHGVKKVVPNTGNLRNAYRQAVWTRRAQEAVDLATKEIARQAAIAIPAGLEEHVRWALQGSDQPWDDVLWQMVHDEPSPGVTSDEDRCW